MTKLQEKYQEIIESNYNTFAGTNEAELHSAIELSELTSDVAIKFDEWCNKPCKEDIRQPNTVYIASGDFYWHKHKKYTPRELFEYFIQNHYEQEDN